MKVADGHCGLRMFCAARHSDIRLGSGHAGSQATAEVGPSRDGPFGNAE
jgi:hypothetical protein